MPLEGIRAIVLTHAWAGSFATELLALSGAEVIQIEARRRPDGWRLGYQAPIPDGLASVPTAEHAWNCSGFYNSVNLNKRAITLDLQMPEGLALFKRLVPLADVVAENFSPRVMGNLGVDYESLCEIKPDVIMCSMSAYGATGPYRDIIGFGGTLEPTSGMSSLLGYEDGEPLNSGAMYPDPVAGYYGFSAITTALFHRLRTGRGQHIDLSMQEANESFVGDAALEYAITGNVRRRLGNRHLTYAPHGIYRARGDEQWVAVAAETEQQWQSLCTIAGGGLASDERFTDNASRLTHESALNDSISEWMAGQDRNAIAERLSQAGVPAAPVLDAGEVAVDSGFDARGLVQDVEHPEAGTWRQMAIPYRFSRTPMQITSPSPLLGQHSAEVFEQHLGIGREEYEQLAASGVSGEGPPEATGRA
jgi:crotonobetainyl-CoA:carnitine CoA-transferase CaiB-like acyl-CoA transferase